MLFNYAYLLIVMQLLWLVALKFQPPKHLVQLWCPIRWGRGIGWSKEEADIRSVERL
jgi:hypothetical protein